MRTRRRRSAVTGGHFFWMFAMAFAGAIVMLRELRTEQKAGAADSPATTSVQPPAPVAVALCCAALIVAFWAELRVVEIAALTQRPFPAWYAVLPILPINEDGPLFGHTPFWVGYSLIALAAAQTALLYALFRSLRNRRTGRIVPAVAAVAAVAMLVLALLSRGTAATNDLYLNVGYGHLGLGAYRTPSTPFPGPFVAINRLWGVPILPAAYGPLWILLASALVKTSATLAGELEAFRIAGAAALIVCAACIAVLSRRAADVALFALNPALIFAFVVDAHNDVVPLALVLCALAVARRSPVVALALAVAAGAMKLPFAAIGALAFVRLPEQTPRIAFAVAVPVLAFGLTELGAQGGYLQSASHALAYQHLPNPLDRAVHALAIAAALAAVVLAVWARRFIPGAAWTFLAFGAVVLPWYAAWPIPYALLEKRFFAAYLITLPLLAFDLATSFALTPAARVLYVIVVCTPIALLVATRLPGAASNRDSMYEESRPGITAR